MNLRIQNLKVALLEFFFLPISNVKTKLRTLRIFSRCELEVRYLMYVILKSSGNFLFLTLGVACQSYYVSLLSESSLYLIESFVTLKHRTNLLYTHLIIEKVDIIVTFYVLKKRACSLYIIDKESCL